MSAIRVVVADDSVVVRRIMTDLFSRAPGFELVATAADGNEAVEAVEAHRPDVVVLDIEMPNKDGIEALQEIRAKHPRLPIVMFSTLARRGAAATLEAMALGASDYVTKPSNLGGVRDTIGSLENELMPRLTALARPPAASVSLPPVCSRASRAGRRVKLVAIGASTGGPVAIAALLDRLPKGLQVPVLVVQHMPPMFTAAFADQLANRLHLPVREASDNESLRDGGVWIARGGYHMKVAGEPGRLRLQLTQEAPVHFCRPSVDVLFESVAEACGRAATAVVLTGMGQDGLDGARQLVERGASVMAQDEASSVVWGMPGSVARAGLAEYLGDPEQIGDRIASELAPMRAVRSG